MSLSNTAVPIEYGKFRDKVLNGEIPVNEEVSQQMNIIDYLISSPEYYYDDTAIDGFIKFCESEMTLKDGSDLKLLPSFKLWAEDILSWFYFVEERVYNQKKHRYETVIKKKRLRNKQYLIVGRGAAKTMYVALIQMYINVVDGESTHQVVVSPTMKQSEETLMPIRTALSRRRGPLLSYMTEGSVMSNKTNKVKLASTKKGIENFVTNSLIEIRPMSIDKLQGLGIKMATVDEWLSGHVKEDVIGALEQGASKVDDYLIIAISSEGTVRNGVGDTIKMELKDILKGEVFAPDVSIWHYKLDDVSEVGNPDMWIKANPNLGATVSYTEYEKDVKRAENNPSKRNDILAKRFGIPVEGLSYMFKYESTLCHNYTNMDNLPCALGADLSQGDDFCAFTFLFPLGNFRFGVKCRSYILRSKYNKLPEAMKVKYQEFIKEGSLVIMEGYTLDIDEVYDDLDAHILAHQYTIVSCGYDVYNAEQFKKRYTADYGSNSLFKIRQGFRTESVLLGEIENVALARALIFDQEIMKFCMGNAVALEDINGNRMLSKKRSVEKIDNVSALMDAWGAYKQTLEAF